MKGLVSYNGDSSPSPPRASPRRARLLAGRPTGSIGEGGETSPLDPQSSFGAGPSTGTDTKGTAASTSNPTKPSKLPNRPLSGMRLTSQTVPRSTGSGSGSASPAPALPMATSSNHRPSPSPLPENLTHTAQSRLPQSDLSSNPVTVAEASAEQSGFPGYEGLTDEDVFRAVTWPRPRSAGPRTAELRAAAGAGAGAAGTAVQGEEDWGIPPEVDPNEADEGLKAKVAKFLQLKYEKDQHINTTLLSSSAFANPHIYAKLVDFVSIDETATAFPSGGWLTRRGLSAEIPLYGPSSLQAQQKAKQEAVKRAQEVGKRSAIDFKAGKYRDDAGSGSGSGTRRDKDWVRGADRGEGGKGRTRTRDDEPRDREKRYRRDEGRYRDERGSAGRYEEARAGSGSRYDRPRERR